MFYKVSEYSKAAVLVIFATTTLAPNPLQAVSNLHTRQVDLPGWVDPNILRYTLIIHPTSRSTLSSDEYVGFTCFVSATLLN